MTSRLARVFLWLYPTVIAVNYAIPLGLPGSPYSRLVTVLFASVVLGAVILHPRLEDGRWTREETVLLVLLGTMVVWGCASILWSPETFATVLAVSNVLVAFLAALALILLIRRRPELLSDFAVGWLAATYLIIAFVVLDRLVGFQVPVTRLESVQANLDGSLAASATFFTNPNEMGAFLLVALPSILYLVQTWKGFHRLAAVAGVAAVLVGTTASAARVSSLAALVALVLFIVLSSGLSNQARIISLTGLGLAVLGVLAAAPALLEKLSTLSTALSGDHENSRTQLLADGWDLTRLTGGRGVGAGAFNSYAQDPHLSYLGLWAFNPHNIYIELLAEYGVIIGVAFGAWLLWLGARWSTRREFWRHRGILLGGWVGLVLIGLQNSASANWLVFWMLPISLTLISSDALRQQPSDTPASPSDSPPHNELWGRERIAT